jgi:gamma-glutamyltranspeptidase
MERALAGRGERFAIATPHAAATQAGAAAFDAGGNAVDAALAAATTLAVVYPHMCGVGGDLFALVQHPEGDALAVNSTGLSPAGIDADAVRAVHGARMPDRGAFTVTVPGTVAGWHALHARGAALPWADAFAPALAHARDGDGVPVARSLAGTLAWQEGDVLATDPGLAAVFFPGGSPLTEGERFVNPALGRTLAEIAERGPRTLYGGDVGRRFALGLREAGVAIEPSDLEGHPATLLSPLVGRYRDLDVRVAPPTSQGFVLLEILAALERLGLDPDPLGPDAGALALLFRAASLDRDRHLADPDHMRVHPHSLLDDGHIASLCDEVRTGRPVLVDVDPTPQGGTAGLVAADADGWAVSLIQSLGPGFGAGFLEPDTGIVAQGRGSGFTLAPGHPNVLAPHKLPAHTLMPVMAHRAGRLSAVSGTMGGCAHPQINMMSLVRAFDLGMTPAEAVAAPRWLAGAMDPVGPEPFVVAEPAALARVEAALEAAGFRIVPLLELSEDTGHAHLITLSSEGTFEAGTDPRADGEVAVR